MASKRTNKKTPLLQKLAGPAAARYGALPKIPLPADNELQRSFNMDVAHVLKTSGSDLYRRATVPVFPFEGALAQMTPENFVSWSQRYFVGYKTKQDKDGNPYQVLRDMTESTAKLCLRSYEFVAEIPAIHRVYPSPVPIISEQGALILCTPGYDPTTGTYVFEGRITPHPADPNRPPITGPVSSDGYLDDSLTPADAFWYLYDLFAEFPFSDWSEEVVPSDADPLYREDADGKPRAYRQSRSLAVAVGGMLALFAANCVPREASRMGFIMNANSQRSGKTLLAKIITAAVFGAFKAQGWREDDEAMSKLLDSEVLMASPYICFDNVRGLIQSTKLEALFTSPTWTGRILGGNVMFTEENNLTVIITGNNVSPGTDIQHRCLFCDLYVEEGDVQSRRKPTRILNDVWLSSPDNRRDMLSALWSVVRHWDHAGRPRADIDKTRLGFEEWGQIIGGMVEFAGFGDMLERPVMDNAGDTEAADVATLVKTLWRQGSADYTFQEIIHCCWDQGLFSWNMHGREESRPLRPGTDFVTTLYLDSKCASKMGLLLGRHATKKGVVHTFKDDATGAIIKARFLHKGAGRHKRFIAQKIS